MCTAGEMVHRFTADSNDGSNTIRQDTNEMIPLDTQYHVISIDTISEDLTRQKVFFLLVLMFNQNK